MDAKADAAAPTPSYVDFEPFCEWQREKDKDTLVVQLPSGFKKEHLRVLVSNQGLVRFSGECDTGRNTKSRFQREIRVAKDCNVNGIQAKFMRGNLHIIMPKNPEAAPPELAAMAAVGESGDPAKAKQEQGEGGEEQSKGGEEGRGSGAEGGVSRLRRGVGMAVSGFMVAALVVALGAYAAQYYQNFKNFIKK